jgi:very-short-patch-repair endonuclease
MAAPDIALAELAEGQHGVFTLGQARALGITDGIRDRRLRSGRWIAIHPGVYRLAGAPRSWHGDLLAACLGSPGPGVASHRSAAKLWNLPGGRDDLAEITCARWRRMHTPELIVHETGALPSVDITTRDGFPCMTVERTLLSLGAAVHPGVVEMAVDAALRRELTTIAELRATVRRLARRGRNGTGVLRRIVDLHDPDGGLAESPMETRLRQLIRDHRLPMPVFQYEVLHHGRFVARVDAAYPEQHLALEYDSYEHHTGRLALVRDSRRRNDLVVARWSVISVTAADFAAGGNRVATAIRTALARSGASRPS